MPNLRIITLTILLLFACALLSVGQVQPVARVPIEFRGPMPVVAAKVNGQGPFLFAIDSGASMQADIDTSIVMQLKLPTNGRVRSGDPSGRNVRELDTVSVDSIAFGGVEFRNITAVSREQRIAQNYPKVDGVLGFGLFTDYLLTLDYPGKEVRLARGELPPPDATDILSFEAPRRIPTIELLVGNEKVKTHLDSGNLVGGFILPMELVEKLTLASSPITVGRARTVSNEIEIKEARLSGSIKFGRFEFSQPTVTFPAIANEANIGFKVLKDFTITFDQKNKRVKFERPQPKPEETTTGSPASANEYAGVYGERTVSWEADVLYLQREGGPKLKLIPGAKDEFTLEPVPSARIKFVRDATGKVTELHVLNRAGEWEVSKKSQSHP